MGEKRCIASNGGNKKPEHHRLGLIATQTFDDQSGFSVRTMP